tara:strand:- start:118 stop:834 length:717 start_codon:yes stop_codon:yes gene_type:complete
MKKEEFLITTNLIFQSLLNDKEDNYSKRQIEQIYSLKIKDYINSNLELLNLIKDKQNVKNLIHILLSIINLNQSNSSKDLKIYIKDNLFDDETIFIKLNSILKRVNLSFSLNNSTEPNLEKNSEFYIDSIWICLSELISDKYFFKICNYPKCEIIFISRRKSSSYCNSKCQTRAKSYRAYHSNEVEEKITKKQLESINNTDSKEVIKLDPENYFIPDKYDVDFGFFDNEIDKKRILGS